MLAQSPFFAPPAKKKKNENENDQTNLFEEPTEEVESVRGKTSVLKVFPEPVSESLVLFKVPILQMGWHGWEQKGGGGRRSVSRVDGRTVGSIDSTMIPPPPHTKDDWRPHHS